jgi:hypothetical protein
MEAAKPHALWHRRSDRRTIGLGMSEADWQPPPWWDSFWQAWELAAKAILSPPLAEMIIRNEKFLLELKLKRWGMQDRGLLPP